MLNLKKEMNKYASKLKKSVKQEEPKIKENGDKKKEESTKEGKIE